MFELIKANKKAPPKFLKFQEEGLSIGNKSAAKYFQEVAERGLFTLDPRSLEPSFEKIQTSLMSRMQSISATTDQWCPCE